MRLKSQMGAKMKIIQLTKESKQNILEDLLKRSPNHYSEYEKIVADIIEQVRERKDEAVFDYTEKFDQIRLSSQSVRVTEAEIESAMQQTEPEFLEIMRKAARNIKPITKNNSRIVGWTSRKTELYLVKKSPLYHVLESMFLVEKQCILPLP